MGKEIDGQQGQQIGQVPAKTEGQLRSASAKSMTFQPGFSSRWPL